MDQKPTITEDVVAEQRDIDFRMRIEIRDIGIPPRPAILAEIDREMAKEDPDFGVLAKLIGSDVALAAGLIKTTNSPFFGFSKKVRTVHEAMLVLGLKVVIRTIAGLALQNIFPYVPSLERFWDASATTADASGWLALGLKGKCVVRPSDAYTFALFRDCGIPVLLIPFPEYSAVLQQANNEEILSFTAIEDRMLSINHALVGGELASSWLLPSDICVGIRHHHDADALSGKNTALIPDTARQLIAIAQVAEYLTQDETGQNTGREWGKMGEACLDILRLSHEDLDLILDEYRTAKSRGNL